MKAPKNEDVVITCKYYLCGKQHTLDYKYRNNKYCSRACARYDMANICSWRRKMQIFKFDNDRRSDMDINKLHLGVMLDCDYGDQGLVL